MKHHDLTLGLARSSEATKIATLSRELIEYGLEWSWTPQRVAASIRNPEAHVLVARTTREIAGFAIMRYGDDTAHLDLLGVALAYRRRGLGRRLLEWLEKCVVVAGIFRIDLEVRAANHAAQEFYTSLGYRTLALLPGYYQGREAAIRMRRDLGQKGDFDSFEFELERKG